MKTTRITAHWFPATAQGSLRATDANPAHIGGIVTIGTGGFSTGVAVDAPTRFTVSADGYTPLTFTATPDMDAVSISPASVLARTYMPGFEVSFHYRPAGAPMIPALSRRVGFVPMPYLRPSGATDAPGAYVPGAIIPTPVSDAHAPASPGVRYYQRILLGTGFDVGPQGADGRFAANTANAVQAWSRWYNALPEGVQAVPGDLKRGPMVAVSRDLTPEKQTAMQRFASRASDVLANVSHEAHTTIVPPAPIPWGTVALVSAATGAVLLGVVYAIHESSKKKAARS